MSYGMFTIQRSELEDAALLRQKLETATGERAAADRLVDALQRAAREDPETGTWHLVPTAPAGEAAGWRLEPMA